MSLLTTENRKDFAGDGVTVLFPFPFLFPKETDLDVYIFDTITMVNTLQTLTTDYTVSGAGEEIGGDVTMVVAPTSDENLIIIRTLDLTQPSTYEDYNRFPSSTVNASYNRSTMQLQQLQEQLDRAVVQDVNSTVTITFPSYDASKVIEWHPTIPNVLRNSTISISAVAASEAAAAASAAAAAVSETNAATSETNAATSAAIALAAAAANLPDEISHWKVLNGVNRTITIFQRTNVRNRDGDGAFQFQGDVVVDLTASGKNGLDTGSPALDEWYDLVAIFDSSAVNDPAGLFVLKSNFPTVSLPSGYDEFRRIGDARNYTANPFNGNAGFLPGVEHHEDYTYFENSFIFATVTASTAYDALPFIPPTCTQVTIFNEDVFTTRVTSGSSADPMNGDRDYNPGGVHGSTRNITLSSNGTSDVKMLKYLDTLTEDA